MSIRRLGWPAAVLAMLITLALVAGELTDARQRLWWAARPLTTDTVAGLLVLLITVLVVNQLLTRRQTRQRSHAVAAQAAIMAAQATLSVKAVSSAISGGGDRDAASDGFRTYMVMLLTGAPVLMDDPLARHFLEQAQYLGAVMASALTEIGSSPGGTAGPATGLDEAVRQLQDATAPLLRLLSPAARDYVQRLSQTPENSNRIARAGYWRAFSFL